VGSAGRNGGDYGRGVTEFRQPRDSREVRTKGTSVEGAVAKTVT